MTIQTEHTRTGPVLSADLAESLEQALGADFLPARGDQLLAALVRRRAPGQVLWQLADLPTNRQFLSFAEVARVCAAGGAPGECPRWYA
ncbi:hypothetical protein [Phycicoccus sp. 3266]|jgi:hypothetical protein|uniref:hypothetical protein n=1 Tax=Phycicoccus sp. 3266 TaxID=2817751 RepID=UPI00285DD4AE|nr:hypothetical protein [Phycicoccus sp. 3266]MDR6864747.1 hypothetical protein [Phycicoccus sp. 3266]